MDVTLDRVSAAESATELVDGINNAFSDIETAFEQDGGGGSASGYTEDIVPKLQWFTRQGINEYGYAKASDYNDATGYIRISPATKILVKSVSNGTAGSKESNLISFYSDKSASSFISATGATGITSAGTEITAPDNARYIRLQFTSQYVFTPPRKNVYSVQFEVASYLRCLGEDIPQKWRCVLPLYIDTVTGKPLRLFCEHFMEGINDFIIIGAAAQYRANNCDKAISFGESGVAWLCFLKDGTDNEWLAPLISYTYNNQTYDCNTYLHVRQNAINGDGSGKNLLLIGDSLFFNNQQAVMKEVRTLLEDDDDYEFNVFQEATQGWKYETFIGSSSPFYVNGALDLQQYMATKRSSIASGGIDYVFIGLGTNDVGGVASPNLDTVVANVKTLIDAILDENTGYPDAKIAIGLPSTGGPFGGKNNDTAFISNQRFRKRILDYNERLISEFDNGKYNANVTTAVFGAAIYGWECYQHTDVPATPYCTTTMRRFTDTIHPLDIGYKSWAYAIYCKLRAFLAGNL